MNKHGHLAALLTLACAACAHTPGPSRGAGAAEEIERVVAGVAHHIDARDWTALRSLFADEVETDYTSLFGGEVQRQPADDLMSAWQGLLTPVVTQHHLGPVVIEAKGARAVARCHVRGHHFHPPAPGGDTWMVAGHYVFDLERQADGWKIRRMTLRTLYQTGNRALLQEAAVTASP